jgi:hypothetical protein
MRRVSPISAIINEDPTYADTDIEAMFDYVEKIEDGLQAAHIAIKEILDYFSLPHVSDPISDEMPEQERYLRRVIGLIHQSAQYGMLSFDELILPSNGDDNEVL